MEETKCCETEKNVNGYMQENDKLIYEIERLTQEIKANILGGATKEGNIEDVLCMLDVQKRQNKILRETENVLLEIRNAITAK